MNQDYIFIFIEPALYYAGNFTPQTGIAKNISSGFINFSKSNGGDLNNLIAVRCDCTAENTGEKGEKFIYSTI